MQLYSQHVTNGGRVVSGSVAERELLIVVASMTLKPPFQFQSAIRKPISRLPNHE